MGDKVELVESDAGVWQMVDYTFDEGVGHAMLTARTLLRRPLVFGQVLGEADDGGGVTPWVANTTLQSGASAAMVR